MYNIVKDTILGCEDLPILTTAIDMPFIMERIIAFQERILLYNKGVKNLSVKFFYDEDYDRHYMVMYGDRPETEKEYRNRIEQ